MKTDNKLEILQDKISDKHNDSFWYDGVIAVKGQYRLLACGEIRIYKNDKNGQYLGMYDVKARDDFPEPKNDKDLEPMYDNKKGFDMVNNNWFEILDENNDSVADIYGNYDDAIEALKEL